MQPVDEGHFVAAAPNVSSMKVRFIPQVASQFAAFGLACRSGFEVDAPSVALLIMPADPRRGQGGWHVRLMARDAGGNVTTLSDSPLTAPVVTYSRLMRSVWLRLECEWLSVAGGFLNRWFSVDSGWSGAAC